MTMTYPWIISECRNYNDFFNRTRYTVPEGVLDENGRMEAFNNDLVIRYLDKVVVKEDGYEVAFKAGVSVEVEIWEVRWAAYHCENGDVAARFF